MWRATPGTVVAAVLVLCLAGMSVLAGSASALSLRAERGGIYDLSAGEWVYAKSIDEPAPIASLTKLVAALTFLRLRGDLDGLITISYEDWTGAGKTRLRIGDRVPARTLIKMALVCSDNCAARALTHAFALSHHAYGYRMQETAHGLGCLHSQFVEPTGLDPGNISTVREVGLLFRAALDEPELREFLGTEEFVLETPRGPRTIVHSSRLLRSRDDILAAKTGYLSVAGYCLAQAVEDRGGVYLTVVLGARSRDARNRESLRLMGHMETAREK